MASSSVDFYFGERAGNRRKLALDLLLNGDGDDFNDNPNCSDNKDLAEVILCLFDCIVRGSTAYKFCNSRQA